MYTYLFEKVLDLELKLTMTMCFIISIKNMTIPYQHILVVLKYLYVK
jgi:hypothetical protein